MNLMIQNDHKDTQKNTFNAKEFQGDKNNHQET